MIHAYDKMYLSDMMDKMGAMYDYGVHGLGFSLTAIHSRFLKWVAPNIEMAHPRYLAGLSGYEFALSLTGLDHVSDYMPDGRSAEYWTGWALAYLQWYSGYSFSRIEQSLPISEIFKMYNPYHEADIDKFTQVALERIRLAESSRTVSRFKAIRKSSGLTQEELSRRSGVPIRTIRSFEQSSRDISKAEVGTLMTLSSCLHCQLNDFFW